ncbi:Uncharacterised protein [uncultured archaeon]|nr:Uncharacterised protein [uncultured archaeon]
MRTHKGQLSTLDAMVALAGLALVTITALALFATLYGNVSSSADRKDMEIKSYYALEELLTRGTPANWQTLGQDSIDNYGLAREDAVLDPDKLAAFNATMAANSTIVRERLGLSKYNFSIKVSDYYSRAPIYGVGSVNESSAAGLERVSTLNGSLVLVQFRVSK